MPCSHWAEKPTLWHNWGFIKFDLRTKKARKGMGAEKRKGKCIVKAVCCEKDGAPQ